MHRRKRAGGAKRDSKQSRDPEGQIGVKNTPRPRRSKAKVPLSCENMRAGDGNRTRMTSLEGCHPASSGTMPTFLTIQALSSLDASFRVVPVGENLGDSPAVVRGLQGRGVLCSLLQAVNSEYSSRYRQCPTGYVRAAGEQIRGSGSALAQCDGWWAG